MMPEPEVPSSLTTRIHSGSRLKPETKKIKFASGRHPLSSANSILLFGDANRGSLCVNRGLTNTHAAATFAEIVVEEFGEELCEDDEVIAFYAGRKYSSSCSETGEDDPSALR